MTTVAKREKWSSSTKKQRRDLLQKVQTQRKQSTESRQSSTNKDHQNCPKFGNAISHALKGTAKMNITMASLRSKFNPMLMAKEMKEKENLKMVL